jgi:hypothetical protein
VYGDYSTIECCRTNIKAIFRDIWNFCGISIFFLLIFPLFLAEPLTVFYGTPVGKHWPSVLFCVIPRFLGIKYNINILSKKLFIFNEELKFLIRSHIVCATSMGMYHHIIR